MTLCQAGLLTGLLLIVTFGKTLAGDGEIPAKSPQTTSASLGELINYSLLDHSVTIQNIRAGNQDESGNNDYFFTLRMQATVVDPQQDPTKEEKSVALDEENFGGLQLKALDRWEANPKLGQVIATDMTGDKIRNLIARAMQKFSSDEKNIAVGIDISLYEKNKKFFFFGEDLKVGSVSYFPVPPKGSFAKLRQEDQLLIQDGKSTIVTVQIKYKTPLQPEKKLGTTAAKIPNKQ